MNATATPRRRTHFYSDEVLTEEQLATVSPEEQKVLTSVIALYEAGVLEAMESPKPAAPVGFSAKLREQPAGEQSNRFGYRSYAASNGLQDILAGEEVQFSEERPRSKELVKKAMQLLFDRTENLPGAQAVIATGENHKPEFPQYEVSFTLSPKAAELLRSVDKQLNSHARSGD